MCTYIYIYMHVHVPIVCIVKMNTPLSDCLIILTNCVHTIITQVPILFTCTFVLACALASSDN